MSDNYRTVTAKITGVTPMCIFISLPRWSSERTVPRSLLHWSDDNRMDDRKVLNTEQTFRVREWKAEELGLA